MHNQSPLQNPLHLDDLLPKLTHNPLGRSVKKAIEKTLGLSYLARGYNQINTNGKPESFVKEAFDRLDINYQIMAGDINNIPKEGPTIVVANHPYGAVDGMAMIGLLRHHRKDVKIMANGILKRVPEISDIVLSVNPYNHNEAKKQNVNTMRECLRWLNEGGLIFMFPAGDVSSIKFSKLSISDSKWDTKVARLAIKSGASVVPVHIEGRNSTSFYFAGAIHPALKTLMLPRQIINKRGSTIKISLGTAINVKKLDKLNNVNEMAEMLKHRTYMLSKNSADNTSEISNQKQSPIIKPVSNNILSAEISLLPANQKMVENGDMQVFYATVSQIPNIMREIGRLREISFRSIGEGSGKITDIDSFDNYYKQLFIWNKKTEEIVGGYRLGLSDEIIKDFGIKGLYSNSLFKLNQNLFDKQPPSIELGRSFVRAEYQRSFSPLMLLWKGITQFVYHHPQYCILFGPVSISNSYSNTSKQLLVRFLKQNLFDSKLAKLVRPRTPFKSNAKKDIKISSIKNMSLDELSALITVLEEDEKGVPVLIKQYTKMGGQMLGFNIDPAFGDCIDGLIRVDLRQTNKKTLAKYLGKNKTETYLDYHQNMIQKTG